MTQPAASMRPGQSCPGVVQVCDRGRVDRDPGFNEAGAIMPRSGIPVMPPLTGLYQKLQ